MNAIQVGLHMILNGVQFGEHWVMSIWNGLNYILRVYFPDQSIFQVVIELSIPTCIALFLLVWLGQYPAFVIYLILDLFGHDEKVAKKKKAKERALERQRRPDIVKAREQYHAGRKEMIKKLSFLGIKYPFQSEELSLEGKMRHMESLWERKVTWSPYAFWILRDNQIMIRMHFTDEDCETLESQAARLYNDWYAWMLTVKFQPRKEVRDSVSMKEPAYDFE